jgi:hypothetical protein
MNLMEGEVVRSSALVHADDTDERAFLFVTNRRLVIEFSRTTEKVLAAMTAAVRGEPIPRPLIAPLEEIARVQVIHRPAGPSVLKLTVHGGSTIWLTEQADRLADAILRGIASAQSLPVPIRGSSRRGAGHDGPEPDRRSPAHP